MGLLSNFLGGGGADAAREAARQQVRAIRQGQEILQEQAGVATEALQPFQQVGLSALPEFQAGSTQQGFENQLTSILQGQAFQPLLQEAERGVRNQLANVGLSRSGAGIQTLAQARPEAALNLANMARQRNMQGVNVGLGAAQGVGNIATGLGQGLAGLQQQIGQAQAVGTLGAQQARSQGLQNLLNTGLAAAMFVPTGGASSILQTGGGLGALGGGVGVGGFA